MPVGHGAWKASDPLSDLDQLLSIAMYDPNVNAKQVVGVCNTQQRLVHPLPHTFHTRCPRWDAASLRLVALMKGLGGRVATYVFRGEIY